MTIDWQGAMLDPLYEVQGVAATITTQATSGAVDVIAIDKTAGVEVAVQAGDGSVDMLTIRPAADVRMAELQDKGVVREDLAGGTIDINGAQWQIDSTMLRPTPSGAEAGEIRLLLLEV